MVAYLFVYWSVVDTMEICVGDGELAVGHEPQKWRRKAHNLKKERHPELDQLD